jgi:hypothetical protein
MYKIYNIIKIFNMSIYIDKNLFDKNPVYKSIPIEQQKPSTTKNSQPKTSLDKNSQPNERQKPIQKPPKTPNIQKPLVRENAIFPYFLSPPVYI